MKVAGCAQSYALAFAALLVFLGVAGGNSNDVEPSLQCYQCNSEYDPRCGDPFDPYALGTVNCSLIEPLEHLQGKKPRICRKNIQKVYGKVRVVRSCGYLEDDYLNEKKCLYRSGTYNVYNTYCSCTGHLCNAATSLPTSATNNMIFLVSAAWVFISGSASWSSSL
ncbi:Hypothetical protein NTJ_00082 [Nesidiocoris tenuis]|uniref:Protein sleepless n=1 Tax=Nesidiocoris tenuis TaxID=355587 RepID=A0ABN7A5C0_9HEMI|nr:Hypothetical protein NTJ_00082 [Nesidiocoris tenuis]